MNAYDSLEMSNEEMELAQLAEELRELRQEIARLDERKLVGQPVDDAEYQQIKSRISELSDKQRQKMDQVHGYIETPETGPVAGILDFIVDRWVFLMLAGLVVAFFLGYFYINAQSEKAAEQMASKDVEIIGDFLELSEDQKKALMGKK